MIMTEIPLNSFVGQRSTKRKKVRFIRISDSSLMTTMNTTGENDFISSVFNENNLSNETFSQINIRPTIHWGPVVEGVESNLKEKINTDTEHFDALFARSNFSNSPTVEFSPRSSSSCSTNNEILNSNGKTRSSISSTTNKSSSESTNENSTSARTKRKNFSLTHGTQTFLQATNIQNEPLEPLERSCSYKRPQSMKKYRQKRKEKEQPTPTTNTSRQSNPITSSVNSSRKSIGGTVTDRVSATDLMATDDPHDQWSNLQSQRSGRLGSLPLDQLQLPVDADQEVYLVRQFNTTSKGFVNRGDSFKRSFKRSGSISRRSSFRTNPNSNGNEGTNSQEHDLNPSSTINRETRTSNHSLTNSSGANPNGMVDSHFIDNNGLLTSPIPLDDEDEDEDEENPLVETIQTADGRLENIRVYQIYLLGMSGTGKCSLIRQFKSTEYRGIYDYSSSTDDDPDNTVSIMLDGVESRLHIVTVDVDLVKSKLSADGFVVVYSITDRQSFQTAVNIVKNIRENENFNEKNSSNIFVPIILVGNKSDLVRKRSVTKEMARHLAIKFSCKFVETSAAINDKVDDLLAGTLKQIRLAERARNDHRRRLTLVAASFETNDSETPILKNDAENFNNVPTGRNSKNIFRKFFSVFKRKPLNLQLDVENLNTPFQCK